MLKLFKNIAAYLRVRQDWEDLCARCGRCCFERITYKDGATEIDYSAPCGFLDLETAECSVYEDRFAMCPGCNRVTPFKAMRKGVLPDECSYRQIFD